MKKLFALLLIASTVYALENYQYQPYPTLLVHGFNSDPYGTYGLMTDKEQCLNQDLQDL